MSSPRFALVIPARNATAGANPWPRVLAAVRMQTLRPRRLLLTDTESTDETAALAAAAGFEVIPVARREFDHGATRQAMVEAVAAEVDFVIFLCQDALLTAPDAFARLLACFDNPRVGAAYGRQLADRHAPLLERLAREANYPAESHLRTEADIPQLGLRTAFCSDTFSAYRLEALRTIGGLPRTPFGEDMLAAAQLLLHHYAIAYCAEAAVLHSHAHTLRQEFARGRAIGEMHRLHPWLLERFGSAEGSSGALLRRVGWALPLVAPRLLLKYLGYRYGRRKNSGATER